MIIRPLVGLSTAAILIIGPVALGAAHSDTPHSDTPHSDTPSARSSGDPIAQSVILDGRLTTPTRLAVSYVIAGNSAVFSDASTGDPLLADGGELGSVSVFIDGRAVGGSDAGYVTCAAGARVREYYDSFPTQKFQVRAGSRHRVRVVTRYCNPDGTESRTTQRVVVR